MKWFACVLIVAAGCKKDAAPTKGQGSATAAVAGDALTSGGSNGSGASSAVLADSVGSGSAQGSGATSQPVELLRTVPATIRVSSRVRNKTILPQHIADRNLQTAWNSLTGEMVGAWIDITVESGSRISEVRMTIGHTGKGKKGEDWFTMNPRITRVRVTTDAAKTPTVVALDADKRDLQAIAVSETTHVRIEIAEVKPGTKKKWREAAVSELEVWGHAPAGWVAPARPLIPIVLVGEPVAEVSEEDPCANLAAEKEAREAERRASDKKCNELESQEDRDQCMVDPPGDPECSAEPLPIENIAAPWTKAIEYCETHDNVYGPRTCSLSVYTANGHAVVTEVQFDHASGDVAVHEAAMADVFPGAPAELVFRFDVDSYGEKVRQLVVCRAARKVECSSPIVLSGPGWMGDARFEQGAAEVFVVSGSPPATHLGAKPLVFQPGR